MLKKSLVLLAMLGACAPAAQRDAAQQQQDARVVACRQDAERVVLYRDRGQTMRDDEVQARIGVVGYSGFQATNNRLGATFERDRLAAECVRNAAPPGGGMTGPNAPGNIPGNAPVSGSGLTVLPEASRPAAPPSVR